MNDATNNGNASGTELRPLRWDDLSEREVRDAARLLRRLRAGEIITPGWRAVRQHQALSNLFNLGLLKARRMATPGQMHFVLRRRRRAGRPS